jgi:hypothetical protein
MGANVGRTATAVMLTGVLLGVPLISASAATVTQTAKIKVAVAAYARTIAKERANFQMAVKPSRDAVVAIGKPAERVRRAKVKVALATFNQVVVTEKAPSIAAEKSYKAVILKLVTDPKNATLKLQAKTALLSLKNATSALKVDAKVRFARIAFARARTHAMAAFKATIAQAVHIRHVILVQEIAKFKAGKAKGQITLKAAIKAAYASK